MDPFTKQGNCPRTLIESHTKAGPLQDQVPRFDIRQPFRSHPCRGPIHYSTKLCFNLSLDNRGPFRITMQCLNPWTQWNWFQQCMSLLKQCSTCPWTAGYLRAENASIHNKTVV
ncbi:hypothetical protein TNCT_403281 [Trichonephila clavata]|uniref:Uncharacterized protein n=1 Tax=Trichonephila clavata TaxID=2740835 RepID=A0A8X6HB30_TRICU|nr:hypothetical protein TNCT_403281 [Trichonephila clavata]